MVLENLDQDQKINLPRVSTTVGLNLTLALRSCEQTFWRKLTALQRWTFKIVFERKKNISWFAVSCFFNVFLWWLWSQLFQAGFYFSFFQGGFYYQFFQAGFHCPKFQAGFQFQLFQAGFHFQFFSGWFHFFSTFNFFRLVFNINFFKGCFSISTFSGRFSISIFFKVAFQFQLYSG